MDLPLIQIPESYAFLFEPHTFKVCYGGRSAGRSWSYARALLIRALQKRELILCCRQIQGSIRESTHRLLVDQISILGLEDFFTVGQHSIIADKPVGKLQPTGSEFIFKGLYRNQTSIKSTANVTICDVEEAELIDEESWQILLPTVLRNPGAEVWVRFNTRYVDDATYQRFVVNPPSGPSVNFTSINDLPKDMVSAEILKQREADRAYRPTEFRNIWEGEPISAGRRIYPYYTDSVHVKDFDLKDIASKAQVWMGMDPAQHYYPACLWLAQFPDPQSGEIIKYIYNEWPRRDDLGDWFHKARKNVLYTGSLSDMAREIYAHDGTEFGLKVYKRGIDTRFAKGSGSGSYYSGDTVGLVAEFAKKMNGGLQFVCPWEKSIDIAINNITKDLQYNTLIPISAFNQPRLHDICLLHESNTEPEEPPLGRR